MELEGDAVGRSNGKSSVLTLLPSTDTKNGSLEERVHLNEVCRNIVGKFEVLD